MKAFSETIQIDCDVLVIGGGGAGLSAAITAKNRGADVVIASKAKVGHANNTYISAGIIASPGQGDLKDAPEVHLRDIIKSGRFINDPKLSMLVAREAQDHVSFLEECGVNFTKKEGKVEAVLFPGHSFPRNVQPKAQRGTGHIRPLLKCARDNGIRFLNNICITRLFVKDNKISAAMGIDGTGALFKINTKTVILATGGFAQLYENTNNAFGITGDGHVLAYNVGVALRDMEFVQFYPTWGTFYEYTVAMGGAKLRNSKNEDIVKKHGFLDPQSVTRDQLSIAVFSEIQQGLDVDGGVALDFESVSEEFMERLQAVLPKSLSGIDKVQVVKPTAHFCMGGVSVDEMGMTGINGLFVAGELCGGVHGANRLGGNALAEVFSMGRITGKRAGEYAKQNDHIRLTHAYYNEEVSFLKSIFREKGENIRPLTSSLKKSMWKNASIIRNQGSLEIALSEIGKIEGALPEVSINSVRELMRYIELKNMLTISRILCRCALLREESRGAHYRSDFPDEDNDNWLKNIFVRKENTGMKLEMSPIDEETLRKFDIEI